MKNMFGNRETILKAGNDRVEKSKGWWPRFSIVLEYNPFETAEEYNESLRLPQVFPSTCYPSAVLEIVLKPVVSISNTHDYEI